MTLTVKVALNPNTTNQIQPFSTLSVKKKSRSQTAGKGLMQVTLQVTFEYLWYYPLTFYQTTKFKTGPNSKQMQMTKYMWLKN